MSQDSLKSVIGATAPHHVAWLVRTGMIRGAISFFVDQLGWVEDTDAKVSGGWGEARFVKPGNAKFMVQLTEEKEFPDEPQVLPGTHLGLLVFDADQASDEVVKWAQRVGISAGRESANPAGTKWFVELPELFTFAFEFVTASQPIV